MTPTYGGTCIKRIRGQQVNGALQVTFANKSRKIGRKEAGTEYAGTIP